MKHYHILLSLLLLGLCYHSLSVQAQTANKNRKVVLENFTGSWCGLCPESAVTYQKIMEEFGEQVIGVNIHVSDPMSIEAGATLSDAFTGGGVNTFLVDRYKFPDNQFIQFTFEHEPLAEKIAERLAAPPIVDLHYQDFSYDPATRALYITLSATFLEDSEANQPFRFNLYLVEDSVQSDEQGFKQVNYFNAQKDHPYENAGNPIEQYSHLKVLRAMLGGPWGTSDNIAKTECKKGEHVQYTFKTLLAPDWQSDQLYLIGMIQHYDENRDQRAILNAFEYSLDALQNPEKEEETEETEETEEENTEETNNNEETEEENTEETITSIEDNLNHNQAQLKAFPNPFKQILNVHCFLPNTSNTRISLHNINGQELGIFHQGDLTMGKHAFSFNMSHFIDNKLQSGMYILRLQTDREVIIRKLVLQ